MTRYWLVLLVPALALAALACQGENGDEDSIETTPASQATPLTLPTPAGTPIISDSQFEFPDRGYSVRIPDGWSSDANFFGTPSSSIDAFFAPSEEAEVKPNITVTCEAIEEGTALDAYFEPKRELVKELTGAEPEVRETQVDGREAFIAEYSPIEGPPKVDRTDIVFVNEGRGWTVSLVTPEGQRALYQPILDEFIASFDLLP